MPAVYRWYRVIEYPIKSDQNYAAQISAELARRSLQLQFHIQIFRASNVRQPHSVPHLQPTALSSRNV